ncbi:hypothetical protein BKG82_28730 [Mycobacteroides chelonae]|uniref:Uncharacterized protein n=1 Tax=Mycobacteroides chelonae TaxID=1774 RepID=A0A1S1LK83_MYCCH|nr:hypothetical protein BKG82_28730 [Mycobacteroides chelonae]
MHLGNSTTGRSTWRTFANHYENQKPTSPPAARSAKTRSAPATAFPGNEVEVIHVEVEPDTDDLDVGYAQLASEFNSETANGERRAARDRYAGRTGEA